MRRDGTLGRIVGAGLTDGLERASDGATQIAEANRDPGLQGRRSNEGFVIVVGEVRRGRDQPVGFAVSAVPEQAPGERHRRASDRQIDRIDEPGEELRLGHLLAWDRE